MYSQDTLSKHAAKVPYNKGKAVTDPVHLASLRAGIAKREERYAHGALIRHIPVITEEMRQHLSEATIAYAAANPGIMKQRTQKAIETKIARGYDFGCNMRGKQQTDESKAKSRETMILINQKRT